MESDIVTSVKTSQVTPSDLKTNNFISDGRNIISNLKNIIALESLIGINRIYLFQPNKIIHYISYLHSFGLLALTVYLINRDDVWSATFLVIKQALCAEYCILLLNALFSNKKKWLKLFHNLNSFDCMLNINKDIVRIVSSRNGLMWVLTSILYNAMEQVMLTAFLPVEHYFIIHPFVMSLAHDCEVIFFCILLKLIYTRLRVMKAHVTKACNVDEPIVVENENKIEALANKAQLDISSLHKAYELLHKCSAQINSLMSFQIIILLFSAGSSTTILLKNAVKIIQLTHVNTDMSSANIIYVALRCLKYTIFVVLPCHYSRITSKEVSVIRSALYDAVNSTKLGRMERRKFKAFFQLTRENEFTYALWGMIRLNMTLPLSYLSLCTTYLVIIIQFSKFID